MHHAYTCANSNSSIPGPYANAILRFQIEFPDDFPQRPPVVAFQSDLFHPLVTPLTTYTYSTRDFGTDTQSAVDEQRLPPGGLSLRHGFPEWFDHDSKEAVVPPETEISDVDSNVSHEGNVHQGPGGNVVGGTPTPHERSPHVVELLQYMRIVFDTDEVLDMIPVEAAANTGAWHAWQSHRSKSTSRAASTARQANGAQRSSTERSMSPRQQPGGARRPGEWNWQGVWEDRVRRSIQNSLSEPVLFGADNDVVSENNTHRMSVSTYMS